MNDEDIISSLVKVRERFRKLVQIYQQARLAREQATVAGKPADVKPLQEAERLLTAAMMQLRGLPEKPSHACEREESRVFADQLLKEIGELLQTTIVMDRELQKLPFSQTPSPEAPPPPPSGTARDRALRAYGG